MGRAIFDLQAPFQPAGDQPRAIAELTRGLERDERFQTLLGVTGSGKTMTMAHVIQNFGRPTLVLSHNKTLAAQLYGEIKSFFPHNAVEYFISYYDYYQPEAYVPTTDTYIEKDASINEDIDRLRLRATSSLMERDDVIIVATVSAIYGLGDPVSYREQMVTLTTGQRIVRDDILRALVKIQYSRNDVASNVVPSVCAGIRWRSYRRMKSKACVWRCGVTRSSASAKSIHSPVTSSLHWIVPPSIRLSTS